MLTFSSIIWLSFVWLFWKIFEWLLALQHDYYYDMTIIIYNMTIIMIHGHIMDNDFNQYTPRNICILFALLILDQCPEFTRNWVTLPLLHQRVRCTLILFIFSYLIQPPLLLLRRHCCCRYCLRRRLLQLTFRSAVGSGAGGGLNNGIADITRIRPELIVKHAKESAC